MLLEHVGPTLLAAGLACNENFYWLTKTNVTNTVKKDAINTEYNLYIFKSFNHFGNQKMLLQWPTSSAVQIPCFVSNKRDYTEVYEILTFPELLMPLMMQR